MNILFVGERKDTGNIVQLLLEKSKHRLDCKSLESFPEPDLEAYDMVLVDGAVHGCAHQVNLVQWIREARRRFSDLPVLVMNSVGQSHSDSETREPPCDNLHTCGIFESGNGVLNMRCRLQEIALGEIAALMRDTERPVLEPITFEYSAPE
jgi:hypothetical protein